MGNSSSYALDYGHSWETREVHHDAVNRSTWEVFGDAGEDETVVACVCAEQAMAERIAELLNGHARLVADVVAAIRQRDEPRTTSAASVRWRPLWGGDRGTPIASLADAERWGAEWGEEQSTTRRTIVLRSNSENIDVMIRPGVPLSFNDGGDIWINGKFLLHAPISVREALPEDDALFWSEAMA